MQKIIILDFITGKVTVHDYDPNVWDDAHDCIRALIDEGLIDTIIESCEFMVVKELSIQIF